MPGEPAPMITTSYVPGVSELKEQDERAVTFAVRLTEADGQLPMRLAEPTVAARVTVPVKFWTLVRVTAIDEVAPLLKLTGPEAVIVKSPT